MISRKEYNIVFTFLLIILFFGCKNSEKNNISDFKLIPRNSYFIDNYNGISVYRDNETKKPMDGYFVVGDKFTKWEELNLKEGVLNGDYIVFHNNGHIFSHSIYINGKLHGEEKTYTLSGALSKVSNYNHGNKVGKNLSYFENGQIQSESKIENEEVVESVTYSIIGEIESQMFIENGRKITQQIKGGKVITEQISSTYDNFEAMKLYNEDGSLKAYLQMLDENDKSYLIELNENGEQIKRIDVKAKPQEAMKYFQFMKEF